MRYVAIDFETANMNSDSACAIGLSKMDEEGIVLDTFYSLICPPVLEFDPGCLSVHGLDPFEISSSPTMKDLYSVIRGFVGNLPLVAHNAKFDISVLRASLRAWGIEPLESEYYCTLSLARRLWKGLQSYRLTFLASIFHWEYIAHNALEDAIIAGRLFLKLCGENLFDDELFKSFIERVYKDSDNPYPRRV